MHSCVVETYRALAPGKALSEQCAKQHQKAQHSAICLARLTGAYQGGKARHQLGVEGMGQTSTTEVQIRKT